MRLLPTTALLSVLLLNVTASAVTWDTYSDTWVATDAIGRSLPGYAECGPPRDGKVVGIFYFIWLGQHGVGGPYDITKLLAANPDDPQWGPPGAFHHWGESEVGYYLSDDTWVMRRHAAMLADAGVDTLIIDVTNAFTYDSVYLLLFKTFDQMRREGGTTPQICFITHSGSDDVVRRLYDNFYSKGLYSDLWFRWRGKPLILANPDNLSDDLKSFFTFRESWAWHDPRGWFGDGRDKWPWLDSYPQAFGWHEEGKPEEVAVCVAQHPTTNIGRSFHDGKEPPQDQWKTDEGLCFAEQWRRALEVDPEFVYVTGWNEWVAQRFLSDGNSHLAGRKLPKDETFFVDAYTHEYSRDIEPMKGGHTDNYYYQMIANIRKYKGVRRQEPAGPAVTIRIDGDFSEWRDVRPEYRDTIGDTAHRDARGWGSAGIYVNNTGRNDIVRAKVARDSRYAYFYVETKGTLTSYRDPNWMLLFLDSDCNPATGWHGYDYLVNYSPVSSTVTTIRRSTGGWNWTPAGQASYIVRGNRLEMRVPLVDIGQLGNNVRFDFHWADNIQKTDDIIEFAVSGDSAPNRRFNYRYSTE